MIAEFTASIIAKCCETQQQQQQLEEAGAIQPLVNLLNSNCIKAQEASLDALATLCRENKEIGSMIIISRGKTIMKQKYGLLTCYGSCQFSSIHHQHNARFCKG